MKKFYYTFLLTQLFLPVCTGLGFLLHRPFVLSMPELTVAVLGIITVYITTKLRKLEPGKGLLWCLPSTILNAVFLLFHGIMGGISGFLCVVCGWILMHKAARRWYWWLCYGLSALACAGLALILQISILRGSVLRSWETHGGFHGDGETYTELSGRVILPDSENWHTLPAPPEIWHLTSNCRDDSDRQVIPEISEGFCFFRNRTPKTTDSASLEKMACRNYILAVYDSVNQILYYYELDT